MVLTAIIVCANIPVSGFNYIELQHLSSVQFAVLDWFCFPVHKNPAPLQNRPARQQAKHFWNLLQLLTFNQ